MVTRNQHFEKLHSGYLFPEINRRKREFLDKNPNAQIISLGIGDTTEPIFPNVSAAMEKYARGLSTYEGYSGYAQEQGLLELRNLITSKLYNNRISSDDIFISDGAKCDLGRLQLLFGEKSKIALQDPAYPVYVDSSVIKGHSNEYNKEMQLYENIVYMPCVPENNFFPDLTNLPHINVMFFCSPNNPTGAVANRSQLKQLVDYAKQNKILIVYDAAYAMYINDESYPKSIYEIDGADEVAIELGSFSKMAGFTGLRLGWSIFPEKLCYENGIQIKKDWHRLHTTFFNGASNIVQAGACEVLSDQGLANVNKMIGYYMENAKLIKEALQDIGVEVFGADHAPYIWAKFEGKKSWDVFEDLLTKAHVIATPGVGFGPSGEGFVRFSSFGRRENVIEAIKRIKKHLKNEIGAVS